MEKHVLLDGVAMLAEVRIFSGLDRKKCNRIAAYRTVFNANRTDTAVYFLDANDYAYPTTSASPYT
ncbi:MAG: hypothetical protein WAV32_01345 [Halobacteriota archaeon]